MGFNIKRTITTAASGFLKSEVKKRSGGKVKTGSLDVRNDGIFTDSLFYQATRVCDSVLFSTDFGKLTSGESGVSSIYFYGLKMGGVKIPLMKLNLSPSAMERGLYTMDIEFDKNFYLSKNMKNAAKLNIKGDYLLSENWKNYYIGLDSISGDVLKGKVEGKGNFSAENIYGYHLDLVFKKVDLNPILSGEKSKIKLPPNFSGSFELSDSSKSLDSLISGFSPFRVLF